MYLATYQYHVVSYAQALQVPEVLYAGIFLDKASCHQLLTIAPAAFPVISADHVTLRFRPDDEWLCQLPLGRQVRLTSTFQAVSDGIQVSTWKLASVLLNHLKSAHSSLSIFEVDAYPSTIHSAV